MHVLSGDRPATVQAVAVRLGLDAACVHGGVRPEVRILTTTSYPLFNVVWLMVRRWSAVPISLSYTTPYSMVTWFVTSPPTDNRPQPKEALLTVSQHSV